MYGMDAKAMADLILNLLLSRNLLKINLLSCKRCNVQIRSVDGNCKKITKKNSHDYSQSTFAKKGGVRLMHFLRFDMKDERN